MVRPLVLTGACVEGNNESGVPVMLGNSVVLRAMLGLINLGFYGKWLFYCDSPVKSPVQKIINQFIRNPA